MVGHRHAPFPLLWLRRCLTGGRGLVRGGGDGCGGGGGGRTNWKVMPPHDTLLGKAQSWVAWLKSSPGGQER